MDGQRKSLLVRLTIDFSLQRSFRRSRLGFDALLSLDASLLVKQCPVNRDKKPISGDLTGPIMSEAFEGTDKTL